VSRRPRGARRTALAKRPKIQATAAKKVVQLLDEARKRIAARLADQPSDFEQWRLPQLRAAITREMGVFQAAASRAVSAEADSAWSAGRDLVDAPLEASGRVTVTAAMADLSTAQLTALQSFMVDRIADISAATVSAITRELGLVVIGGQSPSEAISKLSKIFAGNRERAITIVRTEIGRVFAIAAQERLTQAQAAVPKLQKQWRRSGKIHSRPGHDAIDGQIRNVDEPFEVVSPSGDVVKLMHPRDPAAPVGETINCGCESLPYMDEWDVANKGRVPFTDAELSPAEVSRNPVKAAFVQNRRKQ